MHKTLISVDALDAALADSNLRIVDCRFDLAKPDAGLIAYRAGHIPGAVYAHLDADLAAPITPQTGRHPLPDLHTFAELLGKWGIDNRTQVIAYDADSGAIAARLWWMLRWAGHDAVAVLDGGFKAWLARRQPVTTIAPDIKPKKFVAHERKELLVDAAEVLRRARDERWRVLDARAPERFAGQLEPIDSVAGHIPGARNHAFAMNLQNDGTFRSSEELARQFTHSLSGVAPERVIAMCGSGVTACHNLLALEAAGMTGAKLYAGSWSEWIRDPSRPIANSS